MPPADRPEPTTGAPGRQRARGGKTAKTGRPGPADPRVEAPPVAPASGNGTPNGAGAVGAGEAKDRRRGASSVRGARANRPPRQRVMGDPLVGTPLADADHANRADPSGPPPVAAPERAPGANRGNGGDFAAPRLLPPPSAAAAASSVETETETAADGDEARTVGAGPDDEARAGDAAHGDGRPFAAAEADAAHAAPAVAPAATAGAFGPADAPAAATTAPAGARTTETTAAEDTGALDAVAVAEVIDATAPPLAEPGADSPLLPYPDIAPDPSFVPAPDLGALTPSPTEPIIVARRTRRDPTRRQRIAPVLRRRRRPRIRRVNRVVRRVDAWTVFKISAIFYFVAYIILLVAGVLLWNLAYTTGTVGNVEGFVRDLFGLKTFTFNGEEIFRASWVLGLFLAIAGTGLNVTLCVLFNLIADLVGGVRVTVLEEEVVLHERPRVFARTDAPLPAPPPEVAPEQPVDAVAAPSDNVDGLPAPGL